MAVVAPQGDDFHCSENLPAAGQMRNRKRRRRRRQCPSIKYPEPWRRNGGRRHRSRGRHLDGL